MLKLTGAVLIMASCFFIGNSFSKKAETTLLVTKALVSFVAYVGASIKTLRLPLKNIYALFENETLFKMGFMDSLNEQGLSDALKTVQNTLTSETLSAMKYLQDNLGGMDLNDQLNLCIYVEDKLKEELDAINKTYIEKKRMYRLLPILCGLSVIILIV